MMICPNCSNILRKVRTTTEIVSACPHCGGIWFESGQLSNFVDVLVASESIKPRKIRPFHKPNSQSILMIKEKQRICPNCKKELSKFNYASDSGVILDKCPECGGIWADRGEARQIAEIKEDPRLTALGETLAESVEIDQTVDPEKVKGVIKKCVYFPRLVLPLSDDVERKRFPVVTVTIIALTVLVYGFVLFFNPSILGKLLDGVNGNIFFIDFMRPLAIGTGVISLAWNMLFLWLFGDNVEDRFGRVGFLFFYLLCGLVVTLLYSLVASNYAVAMVWISGAVSAVMGAYFIFYPIANIKVFIIFRVFEIPSEIFLGAWFLFQVISPFLYHVTDSAMFRFAANICGFIFGVTIAWIKKSSDGK